MWRRARRALLQCFGGREAVIAAAGGTAAAPAPLMASADLRSAEALSSSTKRICAICFDPLEKNDGRAIFTAECKHTFHFRCISSNVKHGNRACPICRAQWKQMPASSSAAAPVRVSSVKASADRDVLAGAAARRLRRAQSEICGNSLPPIRWPAALAEPWVYDDDEPVPIMMPGNANHGCTRTVTIETIPEFSSVPESDCRDDFAVLIHLKAPSGAPAAARAPIDLVTVLDVSGSMGGTKLALLKRAMGFVIENLGPHDRLSVVAFSSTARRLFPLRRMSEYGRHQSLQAVNVLASGGGTNITDALKKAAKVLADRSRRNPVCSIILLSDGKDTYSGHPNGKLRSGGYMLLVPSRVLGNSGDGGDGGNDSQKIPVHTFGFGADHDINALNTIADASGGTFSFIEDEGMIQDAFAQCIGGLLSVVAQEMEVGIACVHPQVSISSAKTGSYPFELCGDDRSGTIRAGDLYADEERDFLLAVTVPRAREQTALIALSCIYKDPVTNETVKLESDAVTIRRPPVGSDEPVSVEVDRERSRRRVADSMALARSAADRGALSEAVIILEESRRILAGSFACQSGDRLCLALDAELREMQDRMASRRKYEVSGRAYMLAGLSSHSWQRATARGDSTELTTVIHSYQTPLMVDMVGRSRTLSMSPR